ncbi:Tudor domain-containing protein [Aphelenchoides fujianensis]|nr:Tudor domain-containing protein [Aphelenchoides fujianensis]
MAAVEQPHRATRAMRDRSVCVRKPRMQERQELGLTSRYLMERTSIHRIFLNCETQVEVVNAVSPSCVWVKLPHHTSADYDVRLDEQRALRPAVGGGERPVRFRYFLAPRLDPQRAADGEDNVVYSRVRLLDTKLKEGRFFCYVHFIDYGEGAWVLADCLAEMPKDLWCHPWQTVPVALLGVFPETADGVEDEAAWSERQCALLVRTLRRFKRFVARPVVTEKDDLLYEHYARVSLEALVEEADEPLEEDPNRAEADERPADQEADLLPADEQKEREEREKKKREQVATVRSKEISVETEFAFLCSIEGEPIRFDRDVDECTQQPLFGRRNEVCSFLSASITPPFRSPAARSTSRSRGGGNSRTSRAKRRTEETEVLEQEQDDAERLLDELRGEDAKEEAAAREREQLLKWDPAIEKLHDEKLVTKDRELLLVINSKNRKSPYEFYGHFVKQRPDGDHYAALLEFYEEFLEWQNQLNSFYYLNGNCRSAERQGAVRKRRPSKRGNGEIYGVYGVPDSLERVNYMRVQVVGFNTSTNYEQAKDYCWIRFVDCGGMQIVPLYTILRLHSRHAARAPMSAPLCLSEILPRPAARQLDAEEYAEAWTVDQRDFFTQLARSDTIMAARFIGFNERNKAPLTYLVAPHFLPNVVYVQDLRVAPADGPPEETVEERMLARGRAFRGTFLRR